MKITPPPASATGMPTGPAGGDTGGSFPSPTVTGLQGTPVCVTAPALGDVLTFNGTEWCPASLPTPTGSFLTTTLGEQAHLVTVPISGAAYAIDCSLANTFDITPSEPCVLSITNPPPGGVDGHIQVTIRGNEAITFPAELTFFDPATGLATTDPDLTLLDPAAQTSMEWATVDGGVSWGAELPHAGGGASLTPASTVTDETTFGISPDVGTGTDYARDDHTHGSPSTDEVRDAGRWELAVVTGSPPDPLYAGGDFLYIWVP